MKLNTTTIGIPLAIVLLVGAAGAVTASGSRPTPVEQPPAAASPTPAPSSGTTVKPVKTDTVLSDVLDDLVTKGTINSTQKTAIIDAVTAERTVRREARQEARKAAREQAKADRAQLKGFLADGVITKAEFDKLPADSWLRQDDRPDGRRQDHQGRAQDPRSRVHGQGPRSRLVRQEQGPGRLAIGRHERLTPHTTVAFRLRATPGLDAEPRSSRILRSLMSHTTVSWLMCMRGRPRRSEDGRRVSPR